MPLLKIETTVALTDDKQSAVLAALSKIVTETMGKPEQYVMVSLTPAAMLMSGKGGEAAFVDVRAIGGLSGDIPRILSKRICEALNHSLGISQDRIFLNFSDVKAGNWGWNGSTIG